MASYEDAAATVISGEIVGFSSTLSASTQDAIKALLNEQGEAVVQDYKASGMDESVQIVNVPAGSTLDQDPGVGKAIIMEAGTSANVTFGADSTVETLVLGDGGSKVAFEGDKDITVELTGGKDSVSTGGGDDTLTIKGGDASVNTGEGDDVVTIQGVGKAQVTGGSGDMVINLQTNQGTATIEAGDGFDRLNIAEGRHAHEFVFKDGKIVMHSENAITMSGVQVVSFDNNNDGQIDGRDNITILAENDRDSLVAKLYKVALGREAIDGADGFGNSTLGGINWWMNEFEKGETDGSIEHLVRSFLNCDEFNNLYGNMDSQTEYVEALFKNLGDNIQTVNGKTAAEYAAAIDAGIMDRVTVAWNIAESKEAVDILGVKDPILGLDGIQYVIDAF